MVVLLGGVMPLFAATPAQACRITDLACVAHQTQQMVDQTTEHVGDTVGNVGDTVGDTVGKVKDTVGNVGDTVGDTVGKVRDTVKDTVDKGRGKIDDTTDGIGDTGGSDGGGSTSGPGSGPGARSVPGGSESLTPVPGGQTAGQPSGSGAATVSAPVAAGNFALASHVVDGKSAPSSPGLAEQIGLAAVDAAKHFGFPLALALLVMGFLLIQNRLDRSDPKLALAPIRPEVARFE
jgi:hypothetical protein